MSDTIVTVPVNSKVRLIKDIFDYGEDHHPPGYIAREGEIVVVRSNNLRCISVSHEEIDDRSFYISEDEFEIIRG